ncbi:MAG: isoprenyl transferase [Gammaproteobacteria bacterium]|nr:isoprenyl transferase [Gammaproteobacteria bacterium]
MESSTLPRHVAIIMDGNGRWAKKRFLPRVAGHKAGVKAVREVVTASVRHGVEFLTLFAFSSENWSRPSDEVSGLMGLFVSALEREVQKIHEQNIRLQFIGDRARFDATLQQRIARAEQLTEKNSGLKLIVAASYGGQWDIAQAMQQLAVEVASGTLQVQDISPEKISTKLSTAGLPNPDLLIRTSGEQRISNFLLWQLAYAELYFTDVLWPDFTEAEFERALQYFAERERRFGAS